MTKEQKHRQCLREIYGTVAVTALCCAWHVITAFILNGSGLYFLGMPAWFSVSVGGTVIIAIAGVCYLLKNVFVDFEYDDEEAEASEAEKSPENQNHASGRESEDNKEQTQKPVFADFSDESDAPRSELFIKNKTGAAEGEEA